MSGTATESSRLAVSEAGSPAASDDSSNQATPVSAIRGATSVASDLAAIGTGRVTAAVLSLLTALMTTRMLGPAGYGTVALVVIVAMLIFTASTAWTGVSIRRYGREELDRTGGMSTLTWNRALIGLPLMLAAMLVVVGLKIGGVLSASLTWQLIGIALATGFLNIVVDQWICLLETSGRMKISAASQVLSQLVYVAVLVVLFASGTRATPEGILLLSLGSALILTVGVAPVVWRVGIVPVRINRRMLRRMLWLSTPVIGLMVSQYVFGSIDIIVLRIYKSTRDVGIYAVAYQAYTVLSAAAVTATAVLVPLFVSLKMAGRDSLIKRYVKRGVPQGLFMISVIGGIAVTPLRVMVPVVFGARFADAAAPMAILVVGLAFLFAAFLAAPILTLHERTRSTAVINVIATAINLVADFILIGVCHMGVIAPAIATSGALAFTFVAFYARAQHLVGIESTPDPFVGAPLVAGLAPVLVIHGIAGMLAGLLCVGVATAAVLILRPPFRKDDLELVSKLDLPDIVKKGLLKTIDFVT